ncbi:hypothetical protein M0811_01488 [Anaeramoeba ignava]|uniref:Uncharacterized protein n=1 Tax=Anaeramoeba ignava TaxID=1746090 RepID=A0A9Q0LJC3_ANAIG|nr:hypothetical protein M0811_01488 [Anaeramoeba ignava]
MDLPFIKSKCEEMIQKSISIIIDDKNDKQIEKLNENELIQLIKVLKTNPNLFQIIKKWSSENISKNKDKLYPINLLIRIEKEIQKI